VLQQNAQSGLSLEDASSDGVGVLLFAVEDSSSDAHPQVSRASSQMDFDFDATTNWMEDNDMLGSMVDPDELEEYLSQPVERLKIPDVMKWWWDKRIVWPRLSRMALDYLSIPGKSHL
jgi:hypothetical protein